MSKAAFVFPPIIVLTALVISSAAGGFPALVYLFNPIVLSTAAIIAAVLLSLRFTPDELLRSSIPVFIWIGWAIAIGMVWNGLRIGGFVVESWMIPRFLGMEDIVGAPWLKSLFAAAGALSLAAAFSTCKIGLTLWGSLALTAGIALCAADFSMSLRAPALVVPGRTVSRVYTIPEGKMIELPFNFSISKIETTPLAPPELLKISTRSGQTLRNIVLTNPTTFTIPGTDTVASVLQERFPCSTSVSLRKKSEDFLNPAIIVYESENGGEYEYPYILFGSIRGNNSAFLQRAGKPVFYRHYAEKNDYDLLSKCNLQYLPFIEIKIAVREGVFTLMATPGSKAAIPQTHYSVEVADAQIGDLVTGEKGVARVLVHGPKGTETFMLSEDTPSLTGKLYKGSRLNYIHPRLEGESANFVRIASAPDRQLARACYIDGVRQPEVSAVGDYFKVSNASLRITSPVPEAVLFEDLIESTGGEDGVRLRLVRKVPVESNEEDNTGTKKVEMTTETKDISLSALMTTPVELPRESVLVKVSPLFSTRSVMARISVTQRGYATQKHCLTSSNAIRVGGYSISLVGYDRALGSGLIILVTRSLFGVWPFITIALGILLFATNAGMSLYKELKAARSKEDAQQ